MMVAAKADRIIVETTVEDMFELEWVIEARIVEDASKW